MVDTLSGNLINVYTFSQGVSIVVVVLYARPTTERWAQEEVETLCIGVPDKLKYLADSARFVFAHRTVGILMRFG